MVKFWKEDFKYTKRRFSSYYYDCYTFSVCGESANYLMNKYGLDYPNVEVHLFIRDYSITVTSKIDSGLKSDVADIGEEDLKELLSILQEDVSLDLRNYNEYLCNEDYPKDSRWTL